MSDLSPSSGAVRTFKDCYRLAWHECGVDPPGGVQTHPIPNSVGETTIITTEWGQKYSQYSHISLMDAETLSGAHILRPPCVSTGVQPIPSEKVAIVGGHVGHLDEELTLDPVLWMVPRLYPVGLIRHILRATQNHFEGNLPSESTRGGLGGRPLVWQRTVSPMR